MFYRKSDDIYIFVRASNIWSNRKIKRKAKELILGFRTWLVAYICLHFHIRLLVILLILCVCIFPGSHARFSYVISHLTWFATFPKLRKCNTASLLLPLIASMLRHFFFFPLVSPYYLTRRRDGVIGLWLE